MGKILVIIVLVITSLFIINKIKDYNASMQVFKAINMQVDACTMDMQHDNTIICD